MFQHPVEALGDLAGYQVKLPTNNKMKIEKFKTKEEFQDFLDNSITCVCGGLLTGLHEMTCERIQKLKVMFMGKQDTHPFVRIPKVTEKNE